MQTVIENARVPETSAFATLAGFALLMWGAAGVFGELRNALNSIWDVPPRTSVSIRGFLIDRLLPLLMVIISGALLLASIVASAALASATNFLDLYWPGTAASTNAVSFWFQLVLTFLIFALMYKYVPNVPIRWADVWPGALATALLFSAGRLLIGWYLARSSVASAYGAASSLAILLLYTYYSAQVFYLGAEFTQVYGRTYGSRRAEHQLIEQAIPATPQQTIADPSGMIVPAPNALDAVPPADTPIGGYEAEMTTAAVPKRSHPRLQRIARPVAQSGMALGVIALLSVVNLVAGPLRREKKPG
jgi:membrane protein